MAWQAKSVFGSSGNPMKQALRDAKMYGGAPSLELGDSSGLHEYINPMTGTGRLKSASPKVKAAVMAKLRSGGK